MLIKILHNEYFFLENTVNLTLTGSRVSTDLVGAACAGGGYTKVCRTMKRGAGEIEPRRYKFSIDVIDNDGEVNTLYLYFGLYINFTMF